MKQDTDLFQERCKRNANDKVFTHVKQGGWRVVSSEDEW